MLKKIMLFCIFLSFLLNSFVFAANDDNDDAWTLIPDAKLDNNSTNWAEYVWQEPWKVWDNYNNIARNLKEKDVWLSFASGIFSWDTIFYFLKHIVKVLSEIWLVVWALMIIYAGYKYATGVFTWDASKWWKDAVKWAIYWVLIVIFSYAIMKILLSMFW